MQARFWMYLPHGGGFVRIKLNRGQRIEFGGGAPHEEGYSCWSEVLVFDGDSVVRTSVEWGRDCDGPHEWGAELVCRMDRLSEWESDISGAPLQPNWTRHDEWQRDAFAEAAGY